MAKINRRQFVQGTTAAGVGYFVAGTANLQAQTKEKLNIACIGCGGRGDHNTNQMSNENVIALCDVDLRSIERQKSKFPDAKGYQDYREMLDALGDKLDAVVVSTPDHMHAPIATAAMKLGKHVYCEKPLTWSVEESRTMARLAADKKLQTQMGNNGAANTGFRIGVERLWAGDIGEVREIHAWTNRPVWPQAMQVPQGDAKVPDYLDWDLWLGCAEKRPYHPAYQPFVWRGWYDFGTGALGDMACHTLHLAYMGLKLGIPTAVEASTTTLFPEAYPAGTIIRFEYPERDGLPPVTLTWSSGGIKPPYSIAPEGQRSGSGVIIIGSKGKMFSPDDYGAKQDITMFDGSEAPKRGRPEQLPIVAGHHKEWLDAVKTDGKSGRPLSHFEHAGKFTEGILLGVVALKCDARIEYDAANMKVTNSAKADKMLRRDYKNGYGINVA